MSREKAQLHRWEPKEGAWEMVRVAASSQLTTSTRPYCRVEGRGTRSGGSSGGERRNSKKEITACATAAARVTRRNRVGALARALAAAEDGWDGLRRGDRGCGRMHACREEGEWVDCVSVCAVNWESKRDRVRTDANGSDGEGS